MAVSEKKRAANRANARRSTGPRTPAGKAAAARNALVHGLTARNVVLQNEDFDEFKRFGRRLLGELRPTGVLQEELAAEIVNVSWKLRRVPNVETELMITRHARRNWDDDEDWRDWDERNQKVIGQSDDPEEMPPPLPGQPGPFSLGADGVLEAALSNAGFHDIEVRHVPSPVRLPSAAECVRFERESFGALHQMMAALDETQRARAWRDVEAALAAFETADGFVGPCEMLVGVGTV